MPHNADFNFFTDSQGAVAAGAQSQRSLAARARPEPRPSGSGPPPLRPQYALADNPLIEFLLEHGARQDIRDKEYQGTPMSWALHGK